MSGYRTIRRWLGETNLERKSRLLFGACLVILVGGAFWWVARMAERGALDATRFQARNLIAFRLLTQHAGAWRLTGQETDEARALARETMRLIVVGSGGDGDSESGPDSIDYDVLRLSDPVVLDDIHSVPAKDPEERRLLRQLKARYDAWLKRKSQLEQLSKRDPQSLLETSGPAKIPHRPKEPIYAHRVVERDGKKRFVFYEPVFWHERCRDCHAPATDKGVLAISQAGPVGDIQEVFRVMRVSLPYQDTQEKIDNARAVLIAVGILTVFVAMVALYVIFRYVVVRPLHHLREVSEQVRAGDMSVRAEIHTRDEFEQLAESFNRMLRHLSDAQSELREVNAQLDAKVDEMAKLNMELHEMNRLKGEFLTNMSHELRTPLNSIIGFASVLKEIDALNEKQKKYAANIERSGIMLLEMINEILDLARMESGQTELRPTEFAVDAVVRGQCGIMRSLCEQKQIDLAIEIAPGLPPIHQDQAKFQQILTNLLSNAVKFTPDGGQIVVSARRTLEGWLELSVRDTGIGIPVEDQEIIFEKFRQGSLVGGKDGLTRQFSGSGLGLSIVRELCQLLGGEIRVESEVGKGSTFIVRLPWRCPAAIQALAESSSTGSV